MMCLRVTAAIVALPCPTIPVSEAKNRFRLDHTDHLAVDEQQVIRLAHLQR